MTKLYPCCKKIYSIYFKIWKYNKNWTIVKFFLIKTRTKTTIDKQKERQIKRRRERKQMLWKLRYSIRDPFSSHQEKRGRKNVLEITLFCRGSIHYKSRVMHQRGHIKAQGLPSVSITPKSILNNLQRYCVSKNQNSHKK